MNKSGHNDRFFRVLFFAIIAFDCILSFGLEFLQIAGGDNTGRMYRFLEMKSARNRGIIAMLYLLVWLNGKAPHS